MPRYLIPMLALSAMCLSACQAARPLPTETVTRPATSPSVTATDTLVPSETSLPTLTETATSTPDATSLLASEYNVPGACLFRCLPSHDKEWIAADCELQKELLIAQRSGDQVAIPYHELSDLDPSYFTVQPLSWSTDSRYVYFSPYAKCCLGYLPFNDSNTYGSLFQYDTEKNEWNILIHAVYAPFYYFSENGDRLVYFNHHTFKDSSTIEYLEVGMLAISSNTSKRIVLTAYNVPLQESSTHVWSKSNDKFAIVLEHVIFSEAYTDQVLLTADFKTMDMELTEEFDQSSLLEIE